MTVRPDIEEINSPTHQAMQNVSDETRRRADQLLADQRQLEREVDMWTCEQSVVRAKKAKAMKSLEHVQSELRLLGYGQQVFPGTARKSQ